MKQVELTTKLVLAIIGLTSVSAILVPTYAVPTIKSADIFDGTIQSVDIKNGAIQLNIHRVVGDNIVVQGGASGVGTLDCPPGEVLTGGGEGGGSNMDVQKSLPLDENTWAVTVSNLDPSNVNAFNIIVLCIDPTIP